MTAKKKTARKTVAKSKRKAAAKKAPPRKTLAKKKTAGKKSGRRAAQTTGPTLLSGGNPQIAKADGDTPVQAYVAAMPGWKQDVGRALDALVSRIVPDVRKAVRWNSPFYGIEGRGWFLSFHCFDKYIKVTFLRGAGLRPLPPVASKDENVRYVHLHEGDAVDSGDLPKWIRQASKLPGDELF